MNLAPSLLWLCLALAAGSLGFSTLSAGAPQLGETTVVDNAAALESEGSFFPRTSPIVRGKVASASLLSDELLFEVLPWEQWAAVSYIVDWTSSTPLAGKIPQEIHRTSGTTEDLIALQGSLIVVSDFNNALTSFQLKNAGADLYVLKAKTTFVGLFQEWQKLGNALACGTSTQRKILESQREIQSIEALLPTMPTDASHNDERPRALLLQGTFSYGPQTIQGDCLKMAGFKNALAHGFGSNPQLNAELLIQLDPDYIFVAGESASAERATREQLPVGMPWHGIRALSNGHIFLVPGNWMGSISHHALRACRAYAEAHAQTLRERSR